MEVVQPADPVVGKRTFYATIRFNNAPVDEKLWLKWKGRKAAKGWLARRTFRTRRDWSTLITTLDGYITFTCKRAECYANMTPEVIDDILAMISLLKQVPYK